MIDTTSETKNISLDELYDLLVTTRQEVMCNSDQNSLRRRMDGLHEQIIMKLTSKQTVRFVYDNIPLEKVTKSKYVLGVYAKWKAAQQELKYVLELNRRCINVENAIKQKRTMHAELTLVHSVTPTMYDVIMSRVAKHRISSALAASDRTKRMNRNALRLCK